MALDRLTTIAVDKDVKLALLQIKYKHNFKNLNEVVKYLISTYLNQNNNSKDDLESKERELIFKLCREWGEEASFYTVLLVKKYKLEDPLKSYILSRNREIRCSQVLSES